MIKKRKVPRREVSPGWNRKTVSVSLEKTKKELMKARSTFALLKGLAGCREGDGPIQERKVHLFENNGQKGKKAVAVYRHEKMASAFPTVR